MNAGVWAYTLIATALAVHSSVNSYQYFYISSFLYLTPVTKSIFHACFGINYWLLDLT
jgi:hypothetical protein